MGSAHRYAGKCEGSYGSYSSYSYSSYGSSYSSYSYSSYSSYGSDEPSSCPYMASHRACVVKGNKRDETGSPSPLPLAARPQSP